MQKISNLDSHKSKVLFITNIFRKNAVMSALCTLKTIEIQDYSTKKTSEELYEAAKRNSLTL